MTRNEFIEEINDFCDLLNFCWDNDCYICEDIMDIDAVDERICDNIREDFNSGWRWLRDALNNIDEDAGYYICRGSFDYEALDDDDFRNYKDEVLEWMDDHEYWDEDDEEPAEEEPEEEIVMRDKPIIEEPAPEEDFSVFDLVGMCVSEYQTIRCEPVKESAEENKAEEPAEEEPENLNELLFSA